MMNDEIIEYRKYLQYERNYSLKTIDSYTRDILKFYKYAEKCNRNPRKIDAHFVRSFLSEELMNNISKRTLKRRISGLRSYYSFLERSKLVDYNVFKIISTPKAEIKNPRFLDGEQVEELLRSNLQRKDELQLRDQAIIDLLYDTGIRAFELVNLKTVDIDFRSNKLRIFGKGRRERESLISPYCSNILQKYKKELRPKLLIRNQSEKLPQNFFLNSKGEQLTVRGLEYILKQIEHKTGLELNLHPHMLRHTYATSLIDEGVELNIVQSNLGHKNISTTQIYTHLSTEALTKEYLKSHPRAKKNN